MLPRTIVSYNASYNQPGPFAPPGRRRPIRNITALSYSRTIWKIRSASSVFMSRLHVRWHTNYLIIFNNFLLTLSEKIKENGKVITTRISEAAVRIKAQIPKSSGSELEFSSAKKFSINLPMHFKFRNCYKLSSMIPSLSHFWCPLSVWDFIM